MIRSSIWLVCAAAGVSAWVQPASAVSTAPSSSAESQMRAAIEDARDTLKQQILNTPVTRDLTVAQLLARSGGTEELDRAIDAAQPIGGPRWLDAQTVQVRLMLDGRSLADTIDAIVRRGHGSLPESPDAIHLGLTSWRNLTFAATGTSTAAEIDRLLPPANDPVWSGVSAADRRRAIRTARDNAVARVIDSLAPLTLPGGGTVERALNDSSTRQSLTRWLTTRPVRSVEFRGDLSVRIELAASPQEIWQALRTALQSRVRGSGPAQQAGWDWLEKQVTARVDPPEGVGVVQSAAVPAVTFPNEPPAWCEREIQSQATSPAHGSKLHTARAAEAMALEKLRGMIETLPFNSTMTLGQAARRDPLIEEAVVRSLNRARPYQVDYLPQGGATVYVSMNLSDLWSQLRSCR